MNIEKQKDTCGATPSLLRICVILRKTDLARYKFFTTASQSLSAANISRLRYLKEVTISRGRP